MVSFVQEASCNFDLMTCQLPLATSLDTHQINNGRLIIDTDSKYNMGHFVSGGAASGALETAVVSATAIDGGIKIDGRNVSMLPYTGGSGTAPHALTIGSGNMTIAAAATAVTFASAQTLPAGTKLFTSTGTYCGSLLNAITASTTGTLAATVINSQAAAAAFYYQLWSNPVINATWSGGVATLTFAYNHGWTTGNWIGVGGVRGNDILDGYNGIFELASGSGTTLTYNLANNPGDMFKTLGTNNLTSSTANATLTFSAAVTLTEGTALYSSTGTFIGILSANVTAGTAGVGIANSAVTQTTVAYYYTTGRALKLNRCDQTQTFTATTGTSWAANKITYVTTAAHNVIVGNTVVVTGASPSGYNGTYVVTDIVSTTSFKVAQVSDPGAWSSGGTITKTVKSVYLGAWNSFSGVPTAVNTALSALGWIKIKNVSNGPFQAGTALTITGTGASSPAATLADHEQRAWIEVASVTASAWTVPRVGRFDVYGDWFSPRTMPFTVTSSTSAVGNAVTVTTSTHGLTPGAIVNLSGQSVAALNGEWRVTRVPSTTTFTITDDSFVGAGASTGGRGWGRLTTNNTAQQTIQLPSSLPATTVGFTPYAGVWVERATTFATITAASWASSVVTFTTTTLGPFIDNLVVGDQFIVTNAVPEAYNGTFIVTGKTYSSTTQVQITAAMTNSPGTWTSGGSIVADLTVSSATYSNGYVTFTTVDAHNLYAGELVETILSSPSTYNGIFEVYDCPSATTFRVAVASDPGTFVSTILCEYEWWPSVGNATATASMFATNSEQGKVCYMGASGLLRFGGDGTNAWGYNPPPGLKILVPNVICSETATKATTTGCLTNQVPAATLTSRPHLTTGGVIGIINIDKAMMPWYFQAPQAYSFIHNHVGQSESINFSEIASSFKLNNVGTGISVIASSNQASALNISLCYGGGVISNCHWGKYHNGTSGYYCNIFADSVNVNVINDIANTLMVTAVGGATARNATSGARSLTRCSGFTYSGWNRSVGGTNILTTCSNIAFTNSDYIDLNQSATTTTTGQSIFTATTNTTNVTINGITFGRNIVVNVHPYAGILSVLVGSNNIKLRNVGTVTAPLSCGSANAMGVILTGATGGAGYNVNMQRIYTTLMRTGHITGLDNSYSGITFEDCWGGLALTYTNTMLNTVTKKLACTNAVAGQTAVYGHHWEDYFTPTPTTLAAGTAWATTAGGTITFTTAGNHNLQTNDQVTISGVVVTSQYQIDKGYNGTWTVLSTPSATTFTAASTKNPGAWASGGNLNPLLGKIVLQMNEKTSVEPSNSSYTINKMDAGSGFTSVGTIALMNVADEVEWVTPYLVKGHKRFTYGATAPWTVAQPTFTATNPNNHDWFYDLDKGSGYSGTWKNLHFKGSNGAAAWAITSTTTVTLTPASCSCTGSIATNVLTVTAVSSGVLNVGSILTGTGVTSGTIITKVLSAPQGKLGTYEVSIITYSAGSYSIAASNQTVSSTTITGNTSTYGIAVGDNVFDLTTPANVATGAKVSSISSSTVFVLDAASTNSTSQALAFSAIHSETGFVVSGFYIKVKVNVNTYATTNLLTTVAIPTVTSAEFQQGQYPLDTATFEFTGIKSNSEIRAYTGDINDPINAVEIGGVESSGTSFSFTHSSGGVAGYVQIAATGYQNITLPITYSSSNQSIPIQQQLDRQYQNLA